ncbi:unnamed protein product (mitochondrion) [Plasmodiophora brassicae]|uniref:Uncharacterized protein n=2 Tax=Plasmodiophora brassicae TaxID=37360 RepID=A0A3P3YBM1_PLABS|nr:unnamed protein product [Plasmodiophora brassicae]
MTEDDRGRRRAQQRVVVGSTNRRASSLEPAPGRRRRRNPGGARAWIAAYQDKVVRDAKLQAEQRRNTLPPIASTEPTEPYAPLHDATPIVSRADRKADAKSRLNYVLKRIGGRSDRRGRQLFRDGFPDTDSDATPCTVVCSATQPGTPRRTWLTKSSDDFIVDQALPMNASVIDPPGSTFVTTMVASSGDRALDGSLRHKKKMQGVSLARRLRSQYLRERLNAFAWDDEQANLDKASRHIGHKRRLRRWYALRLDEQARNASHLVRRGLGLYNGPVQAQFDGRVTSLWGTHDTDVVRALIAEYTT